MVETLSQLREGEMSPNSLAHREPMAKDLDLQAAKQASSCAQLAQLDWFLEMSLSTNTGSGAPSAAILPTFPMFLRKSGTHRTGM